MRKNFTLFGFCLFTYFAGFSQALSPTVISAAGGSDYTNSIRLDWTLGEIAIETNTTPAGLYTQGFHQPLLVLPNKSPQNIPLLSDLRISLFPNPVSSILNVQIQSTRDSKIYLDLLDINGRSVYKTTTYSQGSSLKINMERFAAGVYVLSVRNAAGVIINTYKIIKAA